MKIDIESVLKSLDNMEEMLSVAPKEEISKELKNLKCYLKIKLLSEEVSKEKKKIYSKANDKNFKVNFPNKIKSLFKLYNKLKSVSNYLDNISYSEKFLDLETDLYETEKYITNLHIEFLKILKNI